MDVFKKRLDKFWSNQLVKFDCCGEPAKLELEIDQNVHLKKLICLSEYRHWRCGDRGTVVPASVTLHCLVLENSESAVG